MFYSSTSHTDHHNSSLLLKQAQKYPWFAERTSDLLTKHSSSSPFLVALKVFLLPLVWVPPKLYISRTVNTEKELLNYSHFGQIKKWAVFRQPTEDWSEGLSTYVVIFSSEKTAFSSMKNTFHYFFFLFFLPLFHTTF